MEKQLQLQLTTPRIFNKWMICVCFVLNITQTTSLIWTKLAYSGRCLKSKT
jgi:hypothetical protein